MSEDRQTIAAVATAQGRGGVAIVRVSGPDAFAIASKLTGKEIDASKAGTFFFSPLRYDGRHLDDALVLIFASPKSYTGEDAIEFHTHGGTVMPQRVLEATIACGARLARRGEFTLRAFLNGKLDLAEAEAVMDVVNATTQRAADEALARLSGALSSAFDSLYREAIDISSRLEYSLDVDESDLDPSYILKLRESIRKIDDKASAMLKTAKEGRILREGALVVLAGKPNAGKSSLMNALLGENRVIVTDIAGTTRDSIEEALVIDGWPIRLTDTAGLRETEDVVEAEGVERARDLIQKADIVLALDCDIPGAIKVHTKCDLARGEGINVSSVTLEGISELKLELVKKLSELASKSEECEADITERQREILSAVREALNEAPKADADFDFVLAANAIRRAAERLAELLGRACGEDVLDALFSRFCVGK